MFTPKRATIFIMVAHLQKESLIESYDRNGSLEAVAHEMGVSRTTVIKYMDMYEIDRPPKHPKKFFVTRKDLASAYDKYGSSVKVAKHFGVSKKLVLRYMERYKIDRIRRTPVREYVAKLKDLAQKGKIAKEIAEFFGKTETTVGRWARRYGIEIYDPYHKGYIITHNGYRLVKCPDHANSDSKGYIREHRKIATEVLGRPLKDGEVVHHRNGDKLDNRLENLEVMTLSEHSRLHREQQ